jgi:hypothetical protein
MEYDQRVIIRFLWNEGIDAHKIRHRFQAYFCKHDYALERFDSGLQRYGSVVKTSMMKFAPEDLLWMILMPKFWLYETNLFSNQLVQ